ncbi:MAG: FHIPEP family type III secretion protein [Treponema sp.]|nr:FHIPEP family type III secretion protein [Treponema sp.]MBQ5645722.1 FHIPEP family type III secretion protein [Treponema sp.]
MANENRGKVLNFIQQNIPGVAAVVVVLMLIIPLPKSFIDFFMILNLALSVIILLVVIYTPRASSFSTFPRIVLFATLFGLGINISSTRLILVSPARASGYSSSQSAMVQAFANIVTGGSNVVIGMVIFIILIVIQVLVITKGAGRVSEVAARFTLDAMSTKQFDIDNQLSQGYITEDEAKVMKEELRRDIDFYQNMDGSSKFVSGNVKAGIFITVINLIGGFIVGMVNNNMSFTDALSVYSVLTIGDGLLSQLPSLMLSFATGILVTGDKSGETLTDKIKKEFSIDGIIYEIVGAFLALMGIALRNHTQYLLVPMGALLFWFGFKMTKAKEDKEIKRKAAEAAEKSSSQQGAAAPENDAVAPLDPLQLQLGFALIPLVDKEKGAELLERITRIRRECALDIGLPVPKIRIIDNMSLEPNEYVFQIRGIKAGGSKLRLGYYMCMNTGLVTEEIPGEVTKDPAFGMPAIWVPEERRAEAEQAGYAVIDPPTVIATHITEIIRGNAARILGRQEVDILINSVKETNPIVVNEVLNGDKVRFTYGDIEKVLKGLLHEKVSIRNMVTILEALANFGGITKNTWELIEKVREALGLQICLQYVDQDDKLRVVNLSQGWSQKFLDYAQSPSDGSQPFVAFDPVDGRKWIEAVSKTITSVHAMGYQPIIMCSSIIRQLVRYSIEREMPGVVVISDREILAASNNIGLEVLGEITDEDGR